MRRFYATATLWATLILILPSVFEGSFAGATDQPEKPSRRGRTRRGPTASKLLLRRIRKSSHRRP
jgi:hypothetical protein